MAGDDALAMSDEDFLNSPNILEDTIEELPEDEIPPQESEQEESTDREPEEGEFDQETDISSEASEDGGDTPDEVFETDAGASDQDTELTDSPSEEEEDYGEEEAQKEETSDTDFEQFYADVTAPFKANGKMMQIGSAADVIQLIQQGANYSKKMQVLKPQLKVLRMLENHDLLDESKLSFLIDLNKKDPAAINQLLKDGNIDPAEIDLEEDQEYRRPNYGVGESEMDLDSVVTELQGSEHWPTVLDVVTKQWDAESKQIVADKPQLLRVIHNHMASGAYDLVSTELERERMFGRLNGMTDLEAYEMIGNSLNESGAFAHLDGSQPQKATAKPSSKLPTSTANDQLLREKRRANSPTKRAAKKTEKSDSYNPLALSDEEFSKQFDPRFS